MADYVDTKVSNLVINNLTQEKYDELLASGQINPDELYCTPDTRASAVLFEAKWFDHIVDDMSWLRADNFTWHSGDVYKSAYEHLLNDFENRIGKGTDTDGWRTETVGGTTVYYIVAPDGHKISASDQEANIQAVFESTGVAWYYIIDLANKQFKLPRTKFGFTGLRDSVGGYVSAGLPNITGSFYFSDNLVKNSNTAQYVVGVSGAFSAEPLTANTCAAAQSPTIKTVESANRRVNFNASNLSGIYGNSDTVQSRATQMYLYFYVGNFTKSAVEQTAGITSEQLNAKADKAEIETQLASKANLAIFDAIYPVGSIYIGTQSTCPMAVAIPGSTWQLVSAGRALWTGNGSNGNTTIAAGLPNITATFWTHTEVAGAVANAGTNNTLDATTNELVNIKAVFNASRSSSVYGKSSTVQPPAYVVNVWRRTA